MLKRYGFVTAMMAFVVALGSALLVLLWNEHERGVMRRIDTPAAAVLP